MPVMLWLTASNFSRVARSRRNFWGSAIVSEFRAGESADSELTSSNSALLTKLAGNLGTAGMRASGQLLVLGTVVASIESALSSVGSGLTRCDLAAHVVVVVVLTRVSTGSSEKTGSGDCAKLGNVDHDEQELGCEVY